jgi:hypothetical protein
MGYTDYIWIIMLICGFYSVGITVYTYAVPSDIAPKITSYGQITGLGDIETQTGDLQSSLQKQTNIPLIDAGALVWYSGNIFLDFALNFITAIPQMVTQLLTILFMIMHVDTVFAHLIQVFMTLITTAAFIFFIIELILSIRSSTQMST